MGLVSRAARRGLRGARRRAGAGRSGTGPRGSRRHDSGGGRGAAGPRRARLATAVVGALAGVSMLVGSLLTQVPILAVPAIFLLCVGVAVVAPRGKLGRIALGLCLPLVGLGLSYDDPRETVGIALLMTLGSLYAFVVSLAWPARPVAQPVSAARAGGRAMLGHGILIGLAG